jgi:hypothetical protein
VDPEEAEVAEDTAQEDVSDNDTDTAQEAEASASGRPDYFPEKLWGDGTQFMQEDGTLNHDAMGNSLSEAYKQAERRIYMRTEDLRSEVAEEIRAEVPAGVPKEAADYELNFDPLLLPDGMQFEIDEADPFLVTAKDVLHKHNVPQHEFNQLAEAYLNSNLAQIPDYDVEKEKLGEYSDMRCERVNAWCQRHLSEDAYNTFSSMAVQSEVITAMEEVMELSGEPRFMVGEDTGHFQERLNRSDIQALQNSPEYRRGDPATLQRVRAAWGQLAAREAAG